MSIILFIYFDRFSYIPFSELNSGFEFRIFNDIFCDKYDISRNNFAFNEYVQRIFEIYLRKIILIRSADWLLICLYMLVNWGRLELKLNVSQCAVLDYHCKARESIHIFTYFGKNIFIYNSYFYYLTHLIVIFDFIQQFFMRLTSYHNRLCDFRGNSISRNLVSYL